MWSVQRRMLHQRYLLSRCLQELQTMFFLTGPACLALAFSCQAHYLVKANWSTGICQNRVDMAADGAESGACTCRVLALMRSPKLLACFSCILMATAAILGYALLATHRKTSSRGFHAKFLLSISSGNHEEQQWLAEGLEQTLQRHDRSQALDLDPFWGPHIKSDFKHWKRSGISALQVASSADYKCEGDQFRFQASSGLTPQSTSGARCLAIKKGSWEQLGACRSPELIPSEMQIINGTLYIKHSKPKPRKGWWPATPGKQLQHLNCWAP